MKQRDLESEPDAAFDTVVLFSQEIAFVRERIRELASALRRLLDPSIRLVVKPHPGEREVVRYYGEAARAGVVIATPRDDSYALLRRSRLAVTVYSTLAIEALAFRSRSALLRSPSWPEDLRALVDEGAISAVDTAEEIAALSRMGPAPTRADDLANRFFGVREPPLDFEKLIGAVSQSLG